MQKINLSLVLLSSLLFFNSMSACSNIFITNDHGIATVARTMDLELNTGNAMGYGKKGWKNESNINLPQSGHIHALKWINKYNFIGQTAFHTPGITDGMNSAGLYVGYLELPNISRFPNPNPKDKRPELGILDINNYLLGMAASVPQAIRLLSNVQTVANAAQVSIKNHLYFISIPVHIALRDKLGNSAVIEWLNYHGQRKMFVFYHPRGTNHVIETVPSTHAKPVIFKDTQGAVLTNAPDFAWQLTNAAKYNNVYNGNSKQKWDGIYMNGSGMVGIPGDWTSPSRFVRAAQLLRVTPKPTNQQQAMALALGILQTVKVPAGSNPSPSIWATMSDLTHGNYYFKPYLLLRSNFKENKTTIYTAPFNTPWIKFNLKKLFALDNNSLNPTNSLASFIQAKVTVGPKANKKQAAIVYKLNIMPTSGNSRTKTTLY